MFQYCHRLNYLNGHFEKDVEATKQRIKKQLRNTGYSSAQAQKLMVKKKLWNYCCSHIGQHPSLWAAEMTNGIRLLLRSRISDNYL